MEGTGLQPLPASATGADREARYDELLVRIGGLLDGEDDWIAALATVACELFHAFDYFHWTGFYRLVRDDLLVVGPYQGGHGCTRIEVGRGVCGAAVRERATQLVDDVSLADDHIACSPSTRSELVVPVSRPDGRLLGVLDVDSDLPAAFHAADARGVEAVCALLGRRFASAGSPAPGV